ncbi:general substrate transporter [Xylogone sp. PMI_703]|nr:general substrate transporter [Xylogone sp. PMI_703]
MYTFAAGSTRLSGPTLIRIVTFACSVAFVLFGYEQGVMGGVITGSAFTKQFPSINTTSGHGNANLQGFVVAIYNIGCWAGSLLTMFIGEPLGRKLTIIIGAIVLAVGTVIQCSSFELAQLMVGRIITGTGNGVITSTIPVWHAELVRAKSRGKFITTELSTNVGGVAVAYWVDYGFSFVDSGAQWRFPIALQVVFALSTVLLISVLPETPRWLLSHDRPEEATDILRRIYVKEGIAAAEKERLEILTGITQERLAQEHTGRRSAIQMVFSNGEQRVFYRTMLGVAAMVMQQLTGINLITYYAPFIFIKSVGFSEHLSSLMSGFLSLFYYLSTLIPIFIIDRTGRRPLLLAGLVGMAAGMFILAGTTSVVAFAPGIVATVALFWYDFWFGVGWIPGPWLLAAEYAPLVTRSQSAALATSATWIFTFLVAEITPPAITNIGYRSYIIFGVLNVAFIPLIYFFYPETKGKSLEQIDFLFSGPRVLIDIGEEDLLNLQELEIQKAIMERRVETLMNKDLEETTHVEEV